jgi:hypothetical protein
MPNQTDSDPTPPDRLPLRWAVIGLAAGTAGMACFNAIGIAAAVIVSMAVARALHAMLE